MKRSSIRAWLAISIGVACTPFGTAATKLSTEYLIGLWNLDGKKKCRVGSLALFSDPLSQFSDRFQYLYRKVLAASLPDNRIEGVVAFEDDLERFAASRCLSLQGNS
jgi:hypothetical protein